MMKGLSVLLLLALSGYVAAVDSETISLENHLQRTMLHIADDVRLALAGWLDVFKKMSDRDIERAFEALAHFPRPDEEKMTVKEPEKVLGDPMDPADLGSETTEVAPKDPAAEQAEARRRARENALKVLVPNGIVLEKLENALAGAAHRKFNARLVSQAILGRPSMHQIEREGKETVQIVWHRYSIPENTKPLFTNDSVSFVMPAYRDEANSDLRSLDSLKKPYIEVVEIPKEEPKEDSEKPADTEEPKGEDTKVEEKPSDDQTDKPKDEDTKPDDTQSEKSDGEGTTSDSESEKKTKIVKKGKKDKPKEDFSNKALLGSVNIFFNKVHHVAHVKKPIMEIHWVFYPPEFASMRAVNRKPLWVVVRFVEFVEQGHTCEIDELLEMILKSPKNMDSKWPDFMVPAKEEKFTVVSDLREIPLYGGGTPVTYYFSETIHKIAATEEVFKKLDDFTVELRKLAHPTASRFTVTLHEDN